MIEPDDKPHVGLGRLLVAVTYLCGALVLFREFSRIAPTHGPQDVLIVCAALFELLAVQAVAFPRFSKAEAILLIGTAGTVVWAQLAVA